MDPDHVKCKKEELLKCEGLFAAWKLGVINALEQNASENDNPYKEIKYDMSYKEAKRILHPDTTNAALSEIEHYAGVTGREAKIKAVEEACRVACEALDLLCWLV